MHESEQQDRAVALVVDDEPAMRLLLGEALQQGGLKVVDAEDGPSALALYEQVNPDIVLLDVMMPEMDGFEVCKAMRLRRNGDGVPIVMVTGVDDFRSIKRAYEVGATDFVTKPISWLILTERVRYMLRASRDAKDLRTSQRLLSNAQKIALLASWEWDQRKGTFLFSEELAQICGFDNMDLENMGWERILERVIPDDRERIDMQMQAALVRGKPFHSDHRLIHPSGQTRMVSLQVEVGYEEDGTVSRLTGTLQDITERKNAEALEADRNRILEMVIANEPLHHMLDQLVQILENQLSGVLGLVAMVNNNHLEVMAGPHLAAEFLQGLNGLPVSVQSGCFGAAAYTGQAVVVPNVTDSPFWQKQRALLIAQGLRSSCSVPIFSGKGQVLGTISLFRSTHYQPGEKELELLAAISKLGAISIEQRHLAEMLEHQAQRDALTGLFNRSSLVGLLQHSVDRAIRHGAEAALLLIDLDRFKKVNDVLGHHTGDVLLEQVSERLKACIRESDVLARMGGDEFVIVLNSTSGKDGASRAATRVLSQIREPFLVEGQNVSVGASIGITLYPGDGRDATTLLKNADVAMYVAKNQGGNRFSFFRREMQVALIKRLEIENGLRKAIERGEFEIHYQPQYRLHDGKLVAMEALIRWNHPDGGRILPEKFIPAAEESRLIIPIGNWVLQEACRQNRQWQEKGYPPVRMAVNVSAIQFTETDFADRVKEALKQSGLDPKWLEIEITESVILKDQEVVRENLARLKEIGVVTTIDDFGTGYSSITYLRQMPLDCLKIDRTFIREMQGEDGTARKTRTLVNAFVSLAKNLNLNLVAEGIESEEQFQSLTEMGCELGQGFLFSVPLEAKEVEALIRKGFISTRGQAE